tara:strand:- start:368 stop:475 length:108 start_codon:yes stop_codon:yes gene_type:complete
MVKYIAREILAAVVPFGGSGLAAIGTTNYYLIDIV